MVDSAELVTAANPREGHRAKRAVARQSRTRPRRGQHRDLSLLAIDARPKLIVVWSAAGSVGKSTVAAGLAPFLGGHGGRTLLVDLDTYSPSQAVIHGLTEVTAGALAAARLARQDRYTDEEHDRLVVRLKYYDLLSGVTQIGRWMELDDHAVGLMLHALAQRYEQIVVDVSSNLDPEVVEPELGNPRNQTARLLLSKADIILVVSSADPVALSRTLSQWTTASALGEGAMLFAVNRMRSSAIGSDAKGQISALVAAKPFGLESEDLMFLPDDSKTCDQALLAGQSVAVARPRSPLAKALREIAARINSSHVHNARAGQAERQG